MNNLEKQIREAARIEVGLNPDFDWDEENYYQPNKIAIYESYLEGVKSDVANTLHTKGMYSEEEVLELVESALFEVGYEIDVDTYPDGTTRSVGELRSWFDKHKKK